LGLKYCTLSMDSQRAQRLRTQQKLDRLIAEKQALTESIEALQSGHSERDEEGAEGLAVRKLVALNAAIDRLEEQLLRKEAIIREKDSELNEQRNVIMKLRSEISAIKRGNESAAKRVAMDRITNSDDQKRERMETESVPRATAPAASTKSAGDSHCDDEKDMMLEYAPWFEAIAKKRRVQESKRKDLVQRLSEAETMKSLADCADDEERQRLMAQKLELCVVTCSFTEDSPSEVSRIENKKDVLLEVLQCMSSSKWSSLDLLAQCIETIHCNLFRSLPDAQTIKTDANDDEMDFRDPSWDHLQLIYELTFHVVTNTQIDKKTMKKHLAGPFLFNLIHLFSSADDREPQYVKIIVHAIYGRFMALRKSIRKHLSDYCFDYVYLSTFRDSTSWQGLPEILEIFCSIFQGLNVPVKPDYHVVLRNVIVPLHKSFHLDEFHEQLLQCCTQFVTKDPYSAPVILGGMLRFWPKFSPLKEQLFITEIVHILNVCVRHPNVKQSDPAFATITIAVLQRFVQCMTSDHHQVAERSLMVWRDETVRICVDLHREKIWPSIYQALQWNKERYWLAAIRNINRQIMSDFKRRDPEFFEKIERQQQSMDIATTSDPKGMMDSKQKQREQRWLRLKELATAKKKRT